MKHIKEWIKIILFFIVVLVSLTFITKLGEDKPHKVTIEGKEYIKMTEWTGSHYQTIILPVDSMNK